jgi:hypothetical protein
MGEGRVVQPVAALDAELKASLGRVHRVRWWLLCVLAVVVAAAIVALGVLVYRDEARLQASCRFYQHLAGAPVMAGASGKASRLGVSIIVDSRDAFTGQACPGSLPPPAPSLKRWAAYYRLRVR